MRDKSSDIVELNFNPNKFIKFNYDFSLDNNLDTANYNKLETSLSINNFITSFEFLEENNEIGSESYLTTDMNYSFNSKNSFLIQQEEIEKLT